MKPVRIFISSPGDVAAEREKAREVIADLQRRYVGSFKVEPVLWEDLPLGSDASFQEGIDLLVSDEHGIDIAVFILWSRLGSPLGKRIRRADGIEYRSGTEREWDLMLRARAASGGNRPDIFTYLRDDQNGFIDAQRGKSQPELLNMVLQQGLVKDFVTEHFTDRETGTNTRAFFPFKEPIIFAHRLRVHLRARLDEMLVDDDLAAVVWHPAEQGSPFRGLEVFEYEHAPLFFGREQEVCDLQIRLRQQAGAGCAFVLLVGASGSGKSSLARAGVAPAVAQYDREDDAAEWRRAVFTPGANATNPLLGLAHALAAPHALPELAGEDLAELAADLARDPEMTFRHKLRPLFAGNGYHPHRRRLLLVFDQVEELFTHEEINAEAQCRLAAALGVMARSGHIWVLSTIRSDYYARFQAVPGLLALKAEGAHVDLPPPAVSELARIITQPARAAGLRFEENERGERLDARLLADAAAHPEALPLLEYCLDVLFQRQAERGEGGDGLLRWADYEAMRRFAAGAGEEATPGSARALPALSGASPDGTAAADNRTLAGRQSRHAGRVRSPEPEAAAWEDDAESGLAGALVSQAEAALASLPAEHQRQCLSAVFSKLLDLSTSTERETPMRKTATEAELVRNPDRTVAPTSAADPNAGAELPGARAFLAAFAARRLLVAGATAGGGGAEGPQRTYTVAHEALLRNWWRLRRLQAEQAEFFRLRRQVERAAADWRAGGGDDSFLLAEGLPLALAQKVAGQAPELLTGELAGFIARSSARATRLKRRRRRLTAAVVTGLTLLAVGAGVGAWFGFRGERVARAETRRAEEQADIARREAERSKAQIHQACLSDLATGKNLLAKGSWREALAYLRRAQSYDDPGSQLASHWLWSAVVYGRGDRDQLPRELIRLKVNEACVAAYSPDGRRIVTPGGWGSGGQQWDAATGKPIGDPLRDPKRGGISANPSYTVDGNRTTYSGGANSAAYSPDGRQVVTSDGGTVWRWDSATGEPLGEPLRHEKGVVISSIAYSPDGQRIVISYGGYNKPGYARQWAVATGQSLGEPLRHEQQVNSAAYSPDGMRIVTACADRTVRQWEAATGQPLGEVLRHAGPVNSAAYSPDGMRIVTACADGTVRQWAVATGQSLGEPLRHEQQVNSAAYSPDGMRIVTACADRTVRQWEAATGQPLGEVLRHWQGVHRAAYSPDGRWILIAFDHGGVQEWEAAPGQPAPGVPLGHRDEPVRCAAYSPDGSRVVTVSRGESSIRQWDAVSGRPVDPPLRHEKGGMIQGVTYSPDARRILTVHRDVNDEPGYAQQWDAATGQPLSPPLRHEKRGMIQGATYSPDGRRIVTSCGDLNNPGYAQQWDAATGQPLGKAMPHEGVVASVAYSPNGKHIVTACQGKDIAGGYAQQWNAATGEPLGMPLRGGKKISWFKSVAYSPDGRRIVTAGAGEMSKGEGVGSNCAQQWDAATGELLGKALLPPGYVSSAAYSPDGQRIVTACGGKTGEIDYAQQWDAATGQPLGGPLRHDKRVTSAAYSPDGRSILTTEDNGAVRQWEALPSLPSSPAWFDDFVQILGGFCFDDVTGELQSLPIENRLTSRRSLLSRLNPAQAEGGGWEKLALWAMAPVLERPLTPGSKLFPAALADRELEQGGEAGAREVLRWMPHHPLAGLVAAALQGDPTAAESARRCQLQLLPKDPSYCIRAAAVLRGLGQPGFALQVLEKTLATTTASPGADLLAGLAITRRQCGDRQGAAADGRRLVAADARFADPAFTRTLPLSEADHVALAASLGHAELTATTTPSPAPPSIAPDGRAGAGGVASRDGNQKAAADVARPALSPTELDLLHSRVGQRITLTGKIVHHGVSKSGDVHYLNFTEDYTKSVTLTFLPNTVAVTPEVVGSYVGKQVRAVGDLTEYRGQLQIVIKNLDQIAVTASP